MCKKNIMIKNVKNLRYIKIWLTKNKKVISTKYIIKK